MSSLDKDVAYLVDRLSGLLTDEGIAHTTDPDHNRIIIKRPGAAMPGVVVVDFHGVRE